MKLQNNKLAIKPREMQNSRRIELEVGLNSKMIYV
jgi:hypothetical protein